MTPRKAPFTKFGQTRQLPVRVWVNGQFEPGETEWETELWIERGEDWYAFLNPSYRDRAVRVVTRDDWLQAKTDTLAEEIMGGTE